jgi:hypothetical protein
VIFSQVAGINKIIFLPLVLVWYLFNSWRSSPRWQESTRSSSYPCFWSGTCSTAGDLLPSDRDQQDYLSAPGSGLVPVQQLVIFFQVAGINKTIFLPLLVVWYLFNLD